MNLEVDLNTESQTLKVWWCTPQNKRVIELVCLAKNKFITSDLCEISSIFERLLVWCESQTPLMSTQKLFEEGDNPVRAKYLELLSAELSTLQL